MSQPSTESTGQAPAGQSTNQPPAGQAAAPQAPPEQQPPAAAPERPDGVSEQEWEALGDPGRNALVRERERAQAAERALAASRARPAPPKGAQPGADHQPATEQQQPAQQQTSAPGQVEQLATGGQPDIAAIVQQAVAAAVKPFQERDEQREAERAAQTIQSAVMDAAKDRFHDATDALASIDLTQVTDGNGGVDQNKVGIALEDLLKRKPHLGKVVDDRRYAQAGAGAAPAGSSRPLDDRVQAMLTEMQTAAGIKAG